MLVIIVCATVIIVAGLAVFAALHHRDFQETKCEKTYYREAINEDGQTFALTQTGRDVNGRTTRRHLHTPKKITVGWQKVYLNC